MNTLARSFAGLGLPSRYQVSEPVSVWERGERAEANSTNQTVNRDTDGEDRMEVSWDHDYCMSVPEPAAADLALSVRGDMEEELLKQRKQVEDVALKCRFGLHRFKGSDSEIKAFTRFATYEHLMAFWYLIAPSTANMIRVTGARRAQQRNEEIILPCTYSGHALPLLDELFLFLMYLALGSTEADLADRFGIHPSNISSIITSWTYYLYFLLGSPNIWMSPEEVQAVLPREFRQSKYADTQIIVDCMELRRQQPASLQGEMDSNCKPQPTLKGLIGMAPHGAVTFVSGLYTGSISDKELFKRSGLRDLLTEDMAVMADRGLLIEDCIPGKLYSPPSLLKQNQMPAEQEQKPQEITHLQVHIEKVVGRIRLSKFFQSDIPASLMGNINSLWTVACLLSNYQYGPLVKTTGTAHLPSTQP